MPRLQVAWQWKHWETPLKEYGTTPGQFESTPLMVDGTLYVTTPYNSLAALDAETGKRAGDSMGTPTSSASCSRAADGSCAARRPGATAGSCGSS